MITSVQIRFNIVCILFIAFFITMLITHLFVRAGILFKCRKDLDDRIISPRGSLGPYNKDL